MPERIQLRRTAGWCKPPGAVVVARPSKWGNPFTITDAAEAEYENPRRACVSHYRAWLEGHDSYSDTYDIGRSTFDRRWAREHLAELRGKDLCCWCPPDQPCHADVLLELANGTDHA
ncbi:DUF4326 domain-containing protein [Nocardia abscessus]|uniref:DUF4326 domain-containing protein n=1 Tax=Nocardia abscessus TaxID=120957 RepID=UPI002454B41E|nr:DUF4326 domain-containing protein [Nocardia abscessus]